MADISKISPDNGTTEYNLKDATARADIATLNGKIGAANGIASLNGSGKVPESQLPSYVDDVIEGYYYNGAFYSDSAHTTEITPETGKIYVDLTDNKTYRWSGSVYVCVGGEDPAWGGITGTLSNQTDLADALDDGKYHGERLFRDALGYEPQNFIPDEYDFTQSTVNGITFKAEKDGTITLSGTATADAEITIATDVPLGKSGYTLNYFLNLQETEKTTGSVDDSKITLYARKSGGGYTASIALNGVLNCSLTSADAGNYNISLIVTSGTNLSSGVYNVYPAVLWNEPISQTLAKTSKSTDNIVNGNLSDNDYIAIYLQNTMSLGGNKIKFSSLKTQLKTFFDTVYAKITDIASFVSESLLRDTVGWTGKNLIAIEHIRASRVNNNVTYTNNGDGTITRRGTATGNSNTDVTDTSIILPNGEYIISIEGAIDGISIAGYKNGSETMIKSVENVQETSFTATSDYDTYVLQALTVSGHSYDQLLKPMIRKATITDSTYEPYHKSVEDTAYLVDDTNEAGIVDDDYIPFYDTSASGKRKTLWSNIKAKLKAYFDTIYATFGGVELEVKSAVGWVGKNLLVYPYVYQSGTAAQVAWSVNSDGTINLNGTANANVSESLHYRRGAAYTDPYPFILPAGTYKLSRTAGLKVRIDIYDESAQTLVYLASTEDEKEFTTSQEMQVGVGFTVISGQTYSNAKMEIMISPATIKDNTFAPYHKSVEAEIEQVYADNGVMGAKNLLQNNQPSTVGSTMVFTKQSDGSVVVTGTSSSNEFYKYPSSTTFFRVPKSGKYKLTGCPAGGSESNYKIFLQTSASVTIGTDYGDGAIVDLEAGVDYFVACKVNATNTDVNLHFYPMLRLATDPNDTYAPHAMTNRELTEKVAGGWTAEVKVKEDTYGEVYFSENVGLHLAYLRATGTSTAVPSNLDEVISLNSYSTEKPNGEKFQAPMRNNVGNLLSVNMNGNIVEGRRLLMQGSTYASGVVMYGTKPR